jgi:hypothetical protein
MKKSILFFILLAQLSWGQTMSKRQLDAHVKLIDSLKCENICTKVVYPNMSACGGAVEGYFRDGKLLLIESTFRAEFGYSSKNVYYKNDTIIKIIYQEHNPNWETYSADQEDTMTYTDQFYVINFTTKPVFYTKKGKRWVKRKINRALVNQLVSCINQMKSSLAQQ